MSTELNIKNLEIAKNSDFWIRLYIRCAAILLIVTGLLKIFSAIGNATVLQTLDPVLHFSFRGVLISAGAVEIAIGTICLLRGQTPLCSGLIAWVATMFCAYRFCLMLSGYQKPCPC